MKVDVSSAYHENSIFNVALALAQREQLHTYFTPLYLARWARFASRVPLLRGRFEKRLQRRAFQGLSPEQIQPLPVATEFLHVAARTCLRGHASGMVSSLMYRAKEKFDLAVARRIVHHAPQVLIGMYGSSRDSFATARRVGTANLLNFVNSHPRAHNGYLRQLAGLGPAHHELVPEWVACRVEEELAAADKVLVPSHFVAKQLVSNGVQPEKIAVIPYGVDLKAFSFDPRTRRDSEEVQCLYVGQISHRKGITVLLDTARKVKRLPIRFRLIGPLVSPEIMKRLPDNVVYEGAATPGSVASAMRAADIFVLPTLEDAFGLVVFEAMASGLAVVTTQNAGSSEQITHGVDGLVVAPGDSIALADAIEFLATSAERRSEIGNTAITKVQAAHSWDAYAERVLQVVSDLCDVPTG